MIINEEILINITPQETRVAIVENGALQEVSIERQRSRGIVGNIYKGIAKAIKAKLYNHGEFPTMTDGVRGMNFIECVVESHKNGNVWVNIEE